MADKVRVSLAEYIQKTLNEDSLNEYKVELIRIYMEHCGIPAKHKRRVDQAASDDDDTGENKDEDKPEPFPSEGLVSGERAARFLGYGDLKNPAGIVRRLANEGKIPKAIRGRNNAFLWYARDIRDYAEKLKESGNRGRAA